MITNDVYNGLVVFAVILFLAWLAFTDKIKDKNEKYHIVLVFVILMASGNMPRCSDVNNKLIMDCYKLGGKEIVVDGNGNFRYCIR